ncbi:hypothetical protein BH77_21405 [Pseudomonas aeruginosa C2773C]|nr:hypothetical protein BH77_21405 [Pseudomonas aeruginosa C2773C]
MQRLRRLSAKIFWLTGSGSPFQSQAQGVAVHGAVRPRRQVQAGQQVDRQHAAASLLQGHLLTRIDRRLRGQFEEPFQRRLDRHQPRLFAAAAHPRLSQGAACFRCGTKLHGR